MDTAVAPEATKTPIRTTDVTVWRSIELGVGPKTGLGFERVMKRRKIKIGWAENLLGNRRAFKTCKRRKKVWLIKISVGDLGFKDGGYRSEVYKRATQEFKFDLCQAEVGPQLRLQYFDQPNGEVLHVAMKPIKDCLDCPCSFWVGNEKGELQFCAHDGQPEYFLQPNDTLIFVRHRRPNYP